MQSVTFSKALEALKEGKTIYRDKWNGKGMFLELVDPAKNKYFKIIPGQLQLQPFIVMKTVDETIVPWLASQTDILAADWIVNY